jgi:hypothetical protein
MLRYWVAAAALAIVFIGAKQLLGITIRNNTVYDQSCPDIFSTCGERIFVVEGDDPPTVLDFVEPARLIPPYPQSPAVGLRDTSIMNMSGGLISSGENLGVAVEARDQTTINVVGGRIGGEHGIIAVDQARINVAGGAIGSQDDAHGIWLMEAATAAISSGRLERPRVDGQGHFSVSGGLIVGRLQVGDNGIVDVTGASFEEAAFGTGLIDVRGEGIVNIYSGSFFVDDVGGIAARDSGTVNIFGGSFDQRRLTFTLETIDVANQQATINIFGSNLTLSDQQLTGVLADGTAVEFTVLGDGIVLHEADAIL